MTHLEMTDEEYAALELFAVQWHGSEGDYYADVDIHDLEIISAAVRAIENANKEFWQPIETAPKDHDILLYSKEEGREVVSGNYIPETESDIAYWATSGGWMDEDDIIYWAETPPLPKGAKANDH